MAAAGQAGSAGAGASVLVIAGVVGGDARRPEVAELLGPERYQELERLLLGRALDWAAAVAGRRVHVAHDTACAELVAAVAGGDASTFPLAGDSASAALFGAVQRVAAVQDGGPVLVAWPDLGRWRPEHAAGALDDLRAGCDVSIGPVFDGGFYLLALARPEPALFQLPDAGWRSPDAMAQMLALVHEAGLTAGLLRAERGLRQVGDVRAALADPLLDDELAAVLRTE